MGRYRAVVFDMDGVLVDSEPLYIVAINRVLQGEGITPLTEEEGRALLGTGVEETWETIRRWRRLPRPLPSYLERYDPAVRVVLQEELQLQPGVTRLLKALRDRGLKAAVASSSLRSWVDLKLGLLGLGDTFDAVLGGDAVAHGKPDPEIYLLAARRLGLQPQECIAIEDSPPGIAAGVAAGMFTVAVRTALTQGLNIGRAHVVLDSLEDFDLTLLDNKTAHAH